MYLSIAYYRDFLGRKSIFVFIKDKKNNYDDIFIDDKHGELINKLVNNNVFNTRCELCESLKENGFEEYVI
jgi:hypothetical protein